MLTAYSKVTVVTEDRTVDLALPSALPLADVLPQVMRYASPAGDGGGPSGWTLARLGGGPLALTQTLADSGVVDGDVLELRARTQDVRPVVVEDVRDMVEDAVDDAGGVWTTSTTASFTVLTGTVVLTLLGVGSWLLARLGLDRLDDVHGPVASVAALVTLLGTTAWAGRFARAADAQVAAAGAMAWGALLGASLGDVLDLDPWVTVLAAAGGLAVAAGACLALTPAATAHAATAVVLVVAAVVHAGAGLLDQPTDQTRRVLPVLALLAVGVLPRVSLSVGGLASADYRVRHAGHVPLELLRRRYRTSNDLLVGLLVGVSLVVLWAGVTLDAGGESWDRTLAVLLALTAALRSRVFSRVQHMLVLRASAVAVATVALVLEVVDDPDLLPWLTVALSAAVLAAIGLASLRLSEIPRARVKRTLNTAELVVVVVLVVVLAGALGVFDLVGGIF